MLRGRLPSPLVPALVLGVLVLTTAGCSASPSSAEVTPVPSASTPSGNAAVLAECGIVSVARSIAANASTDRREGRLTASEYAAVLNTVAPTLLWRPHGLPTAVQRQAEHLSDVVGPVTAGATGPAFDPRGHAFLSAYGALAETCEANGTPTGILATSGG